MFVREYPWQDCALWVICRALLERRIPLPMSGVLSCVCERMFMAK